MAGDLKAKERTGVTLTTTGASLTSGSAGSAGTALDCRTGGNAPDDLIAQFELTAQWGTVTGITLNTVVAELYLVPKLDGTNSPDIDTTSGSSALPYSTYVGAFVATKAPSTSTDAKFISPKVELFPMTHTAYILNRSGQTISANWTLKVVSVMAQYT